MDTAFEHGDAVNVAVSSTRRLVIIAFLLGVSALASCSAIDDSPEACRDGDKALDLGFYTYFAPVSYSADDEPGSAGFDIHRGYEADLLDAIEAMEGVGVSFSRHGIGIWDGIWLQSAGPEFDIVGGGITILDSRTKDSDSRERVAFTSGHITFRQSVLVRAADESRFASYDDLTSDVLVGALAGTTGEARLLEITGLTDADGVLAAGTSIDTPSGTLVADGTSDFIITAAAESAELSGRHHLRPPSDGMPQVVYLGDLEGESELIAALSSGDIDALARGEIGNRDAVHAFGNEFAVALLDDAIEHGGFTLSVEDTDLASCLSDRIDYLTDGMRIGYAQWLDDPSVFMARAGMWNDQ